MMKPYALTLALALLIAACSPAASSVPTSSPAQPVVPTSQPAQPTPTPETMPTAAVQPTAVTQSDQAAAYNGPAWTALPLVDSATGETFTFASFAGKTVFVEPMATWCTNCRRQLPNAEAARSQLDPDQYVFVGLSVAENVDNATLAQYAADNGWNFIFASATEALTQGLVDQFGRTVITPPSTPHFVIKPDGTLSEIFTGSITADDLVAKLTSFSGS